MLDLETIRPGELGHWFTRGADRKSLELYLEGFQHTIALLQTRDAAAPYPPSSGPAPTEHTRIRTRTDRNRFRARLSLSLE
jgi:hypothetical protein